MITSLSLASLQSIPQGTAFGRWHIISVPKRTQGTGCIKAIFECECGTVKRVNARNVVRGLSRSCGCLRSEWAKSEAFRATRKHRERRPRAVTARRSAYQQWHSMIQRCTNPAASNFCRYGGRGITVCDRWRSSFEAFCLDIGERPSPDHTLDRIDNDGNYEPGNCRWATRREQSRNKRNNRWITVEDETLCLADWVARSGRARESIRWRLDAGLSPKDAIFGAPTRTNPRKTATPPRIR